MRFSWQVYWEGLPFPPPVDHILWETWPVCLGGPCTAWLIASLSYASPFIMTRRHLTSLLRNLYVSQERRVRTLNGTTDWSQIEKEVQQGCLLSPGLFNLHTENIVRHAGLDELQARIKIGGRNINNLRCGWHHANGRKWRGTKEPLDEGEGGEWKSWLKTKY